MTIRAQLTSTHQVKTEAFDGRDLVFLSGTGVIDYAGTMNDFIRESLAIHLAPPDGPYWERIDECAPVVALAALYNGNPALNIGWAVDATLWVPYAFPGKGMHLLLNSFIAVGGRAAILIRVSYQATVLGMLSP